MRIAAGEREASCAGSVADPGVVSVPLGQLLNAVRALSVWPAENPLRLSTNDTGALVLSNNSQRTQVIEPVGRLALGPAGSAAAERPVTNALPAQVFPGSFFGSCTACNAPLTGSLACGACGQVQGYEPGVVLSGPGRRFAGALLDSLLGLLLLIVGWLIWSFIIFGRGQTPAKQILGMRVIDVRRRSAANWGTMFVREILLENIISYISGFFLAIPLAWLLWDENRQQLWDKMLHTIVVNDRDGVTTGAPSAIAAPAPLPALMAPRSARVESPRSTTRSCPECAEAILFNARVCKHCGYRSKVCPDCAEAVPTEAPICPYCNRSFEAQRGSSV